MLRRVLTVVLPLPRAFAPQRDAPYRLHLLADASRLPLLLRPHPTAALVPSYNRRGRDSDDPPVSAIDIAAASDSDVHTPPTIFSDMNAANFDQYGLLSHQHASHHHPQQPHHQFNSALAHSGAQGDDIFIARQTVSAILRPKTSAMRLTVFDSVACRCSMR